MANKTQMINMPGITFHAVATAAIVAGEIVASGASDDVMTAISQAGYSAGDVKVTTSTAADDLINVGIALTDAAVGETVSIATQGIFIVESGAAVTAGAEWSSETTAQKVEDSTNALMSMGRALTGASAAAKFVLVRLNV